MSNFKKSELHYLENYRLLFTNLDEVPTLKNEMAEYGYNDEKIAEGKKLYESTLALYNQNKQETSEERETSAKFATAYEALKKEYAKHRKIAKVALMNHPELWQTFSIKGTASDAYLKVMEDAKTLYTQTKNHEVAKPLLATFKLTESIADTQLQKISEVETLKASYEKEKGESQQATKNKDQAFAELDKWVKDFYNVAKIALDDQPQLLESVGKWIRS